MKLIDLLEVIRDGQWVCIDGVIPDFTPGVCYGHLHLHLFIGTVDAEMRRTIDDISSNLMLSRSTVAEVSSMSDGSISIYVVVEQGEK